MAFIRVQTGRGGPTVGVIDRPQAVSVTLGDDVVYTFDRAGRLITVFRKGEFYRRGLDHRLLCKKRRAGGRWQTDLMSSRSAENVYDQLFRSLAVAARSVRVGAELKTTRSSPQRGRRHAVKLLETILANGPDALALDGRRFRRVYSPVAVLPPDRYLALVLQVTLGCSHNKCRFCRLYRDVPFRVRTTRELDDHIDRVVEFFGAGLSLRQSIFLGDANALVIEPARLLDILVRIEARLGPGVAPAGFRSRGMYSFVDSFHTGFDDPAVWAKLARAGLTGVYLGIESGSDALLRAMNKPASSRSALEAVKTLKRAGLQVGAILIVGLGGTPWEQVHARETSKLLSQLPLDRRDLIFLSPYVAGDDDPALAEFQPHLGPEAIEAQGRAWAHSIATRRRDRRPRVATYSLREFIY